MRSPYRFIVSPHNDTLYANEVKGKKGSLILSTSIENHSVTNRIAKVISIPSYYSGEIKEGFLVIVHHNVFRKIYDMRGKEKFSARLIRNNTYMLDAAEIFGFSSDGENWIPMPGYCFVSPMENTDAMTNGSEQGQHGVLRFAGEDLTRDGFSIGDTICFRPESEYEFNINGSKSYRVRTSNVCLRL